MQEADRPFLVLTLPAGEALGPRDPLSPPHSLFASLTAHLLLSTSACAGSVADGTREQLTVSVREMGAEVPVPRFSLSLAHFSPPLIYRKLS